MTTKIKNEHVKLKVILYFLFGLFFNFIGLIIGGLWIKFKAKTNKKPKYIALIIGFGIFILFSYVISPYILMPRIEKFIYSKYPELETIKTAVENKYANGKIGVVASSNKSFGTGQEAITTSTMTVSHTAKKALIGKEMQDMGKLVCTTLQSAGKNYDQVGVVSTQSILPIDIPFVHLNKTYRITATCDEWLDKDSSKTLPTP